eukprot:2801223-Pleurochrysis_carterae.AAC.1
MSSADLGSSFFLDPGTDSSESIGHADDSNSDEFLGENSDNDGDGCDEHALNESPQAGADGAPATSASIDVDITHSRRGRYDRSKSKKKLSHENQAAEHLQLIKESSLGKPCGR